MIPKACHLESNDGLRQNDTQLDALRVSRMESPAWFTRRGSSSLACRPTRLETGPDDFTSWMLG